MMLDSNFQFQLPKLENIIEANPPTANRETLVLDIIRQISQPKAKAAPIYSYILIVDRDRHLVGIITERDIVKLTAAQADLATLRAAEVMSKNVITLHKSALSDLDLVLRTLRQHKIRHLPILGDRDRLEGIVSFSQICEAIHPSNLLKFRRVSEVMNSQVLSATPETSLLKLSQLMLVNQKSYVVIAQTAADSSLIPVGIVTERDLVRLQLERQDMVQTPAQTVMSHPLECLAPEDPLIAVQQKMNQLQVRRLVITDSAGKLAGIVTQLNMIKAIDPKEVYKVVNTLQRQLHIKTQEIRQTNQELQQAIRQQQSMSEQLTKEKELAKITLQSIGEGIITINTQGEIEEFNPVAEQLTGWQASEVKGKLLSSVVRVYDEQTKQEIPTLLARVAQSNLNYQEKTVLLAQDGTEYAIQDSVAPICDRQGKTLGVVWIFRDVTKSRRLTAQLSWQASHDTLTGLYNRRKFNKKLRSAIVSSQRDAEQHALCYCDLDRFKTVNDTCGHGAGDEVLKQVTKLLSQRVRSADTLARLGGDEFGLLLYQCSLEEAEMVAQTLRQTIADFTFTWQRQTFSLGISIGIVPIDASSSNLKQLIARADAACYRAKAQKRNQLA